MSDDTSVFRPMLGRSAGLQPDFARTLLYALTATAHGNKGKLVARLVAGLAPQYADSLAAESYRCCLQRSVFVHFIDAKHMVVGIHQPVRFLQFDDVVNLSGIDQAVATKDELIGWNGRDDLLVETHDFDELAALHLVESGFLDGLTYMLAVGRHH